ncbi:MAG: FolC bifunctional protein [Deltaproteobacteria bacterium]|nr:FolC bifunctional protein [Deltaproteobacteria bacterium]
MGAAYEALLARLLPARRFGVVLGLERIRALLDRLGAPDRRLGTVVHVGGTNGKGSTVAMIAALVSHGDPQARVATYTSPHLSCLRERISISGELIDEATLVAAADRVRAAGGDELTFFEQLTAIAAVAIADANVDVTVLEVGLGGRLDATNAIDAQIAVVTGVAMDHEAILGATLTEIAGEKAGIFKPGQRVVIGASGEPAAVSVLRARAAIAANVTVIDEAAIARVPPVALPGAHQRRNAAAALAALDHLEALGVVQVSAAARGQALAALRHPGRFEVVGDIILDGAHNPHGAAALAAAVTERGLRPVLVIAVSADKDVRGIASALAPVVCAVVATRYQQERALAPEKLAAIFGALGIPTEQAPDLAGALALALARAQGAPVLVAGSLFLIGEARILLLGAPADPFVVTDPPVR